MSNQPTAKRQAPGIPFKQIWDAGSFRTPDTSAFSWQWLAGVPGALRVILIIGLSLLALHIMNLL